MKKIICLTLALSSLSAFAKTDLEKKLDALSIPDDKVTPALSRDKLHIVNTRYSSLTNRHEFTLAGSNNFNSESHLETKQGFATYRYHINSKWSVGLKHSIYNNVLSSSGKRLFKDKSLLPDSDFAYKSTELLGTYNGLYGKLRWSTDTVVYFDQYFTLGYGDIELESGPTKTYSLDLGMAFWIGKHMSTRFGVKNEFYKQTKLTGNETAYNTMGYIEFGYLFGEGNQG